MIQSYTQNSQRFNTMALLQKLSSSMMQLLTLTVLIFTLGMSQQVQAQSITVTPQVVSGSITAVSGTGDVDVPRPVGLQVGDLILVNVSSRTQAGTLTNAGYTLIGTSSPAGTFTSIPKTFAFYKIADATDVSNGTYTFTASGNVFNRGFHVTAVRVAAGSFDATTPVNTVVSTAEVTTNVTSISVPQLTGLPAKSVLMGFHATNETTSFVNTGTPLNTPVGMTRLNSANAAPAQRLVTQTYPTGGNTGAKDWTWATSTTVAGMIYALNPSTVPCGSISGVLTSTTGGDFSMGSIASVSVQGDNTLLRANVTYTINYTLSGANSGTFMATSAPADNGTLRFNVLPSALLNQGATTITVNTIQPQGCPVAVSLSSNNSATLTIGLGITPQVVASSVTTVSGTGNVNVPRPIGLQVGDLILVNVSSRFQGGTLTRAGYTLIGTSSTAGTDFNIPKTFAYYKIADASDVNDATYTFTAGGTPGTNFFVTAVRVAAGTFDAASPIVIGGFSTGETTVGAIGISPQQLTSLPPKSVLMGFNGSSNVNTYTPDSHLGMTELFTRVGNISQRLATQIFPNGGNTGTKSWVWATANSGPAAAMLYALKPNTVQCSSFTGGLITTTGGTSGIGSNAAVSVQGDPALIRANVSYTITYNLSGVNNGIGLISTATSTANGSLSFSIPASALPNIGLSTVTITAIQVEGCPTPVSISANNTATLDVSLCLTPQVVENSLTVASGTGTINVPRPIGLQVGDLILVNVSSNTQAATLDNAAYTLIGTSATGSSTTFRRTFAYYKIADATDVSNATYTFTAGGNATSRSFTVLAVRVAAGTFDPAAPIVSGAFSSNRFLGFDITIPQLTALPSNSVLMGMCTSQDVKDEMPSGMVNVGNTISRLGTQTFPSGGNTGDKKWPNRFNSSELSGILYALNRTCLSCNDLTGGLISTTAGSYSAGTDATITLQGDPSLLRQGLTYTITYNLTGTNSGVFTATASPTANGSLSFTIPWDVLECDGASITITNIQAQGCPTPVAISVNNSATLNMVIVSKPLVVAGSLTLATGTADIAVPRPIGLQEGDLILVNVSSATQAATLTNAGYTLIGTTTEGAATTTVQRVFAYYKIADASDVSNATYTFIAGGNATGRNFVVTAVRVAAGTFNPAAPIVSGGVAVAGGPTTVGAQITVPGLSALPSQSVLMGFHSVFLSNLSSATPAGMTLLNTITTVNGYKQLLATQNFPNGGSTGDKSWKWTITSGGSAAAAMMYALNPAPAVCSAGALSSTTGGGTYPLGTSPVITLNGPDSLFQADVEYTITYNLSGANSGTGLTATASSNQNGILSFTVPASVLPTLGSTTVMVTSIGRECCPLVALSANNTAILTMQCGSISSTYTNPINSQGIDQNVVLYFSNFSPGTYTVTYNLTGANTATGATSTMQVSSSVAGFNIPAALLTNTGATAVTISSITGTQGCFTSLPAPLNFIVQPNTNPYSGIGSGGDCGQSANGTCGNTNYNNAYMASWDDPMTIEYDNFTSTFHSTAVRTPDGTFSVWGQSAGNNGSNVLSPQKLDNTNYPALGSHQVLKVTGGSGGSFGQILALTTDGLYTSSNASMISTTIAGSPTFAKVLPTNGNAFALPPGVSPADVKMLQGTYQHLYLVTCEGNAWVLGNNANNRGAGGAGDWNNWSQVQTGPGVPLTGIIAMRGTSTGVIALRNDNTLWAWGQSSFLGNSTAEATRNFATQMTHPNAAKTIKMIGITRGSSFYALMTDGNLYALGNNAQRQLGTWNNTTSLNWIQPKYNSTAGPAMDNIHWISTQEHDAFTTTQNPSVNVLTKQAQLYAFGTSNFFMLGTTADPADPQIPQGISSTDEILSVESGGHTSMIIKKCETNFGYVGHRVDGSMGNGSGDNSFEPVYSFATAEVQICGAGQPNIEILQGGVVVAPQCINETYPVTVTPAGGTLTYVSGPATLSGFNLTTTGPGTVTLQYTTPANVCGTSQIITRSFTIAPPLIINNLVDATYCQNGTPTPLNVTATGSNNTFQWYSNTTASNTGGTAIAGATNASYAPPTGAVGTFYYYVVVTGENGVCPKVSNVAMITVLVPSISASAASYIPSLCINTALSPVITHSTIGATGIGTPVGLPTGITASWLANTITISGTPTATGTYSYFIPLTGGNCPEFAEGIITVIGNNTVTASTPQTLCINTALSPNMTHTTTGATGIANDGVSGANGLPAGVSATWAGNTITISGTPSASGTFPYSIPLTGGCGTVSATGTITVNVNSVTASTPQTVCINTALSPDMTHTTTGATGIGTPTGLPAGVTATWAANTITISGTPNASGTFSYSIPLTGGCGAVSATGTITVNTCSCANPPTVTITGDNDVCTGNTITLTGTFTIAANATWSIVSGGGSLSTTTCGSSPCTTVYTPGATGTVVIRLVTDDPDGAGPCTAAEAEHIIIVRRVPVLGPVQRN